MTMASHQKIVDALLSLNSSKKKEKLEAFENLNELLNQNSIVKSLNENSLAHEKNVNWNLLFVRVHNAAVSLVDENSTKTRQLSDKNIQVIKCVLQLVVQQSLHQKVMFISSSLIVASILSVFETDFRSKLLGCTYITIFSKYILSERRNWSQLKKEHWLGMKELCKKLTKTPLPGTHCAFFLEILCDIIKNSCKNCQISHDYLDLFTFLIEVFSTYRGMGINNEIILLRVTNMLCLQLAVEYRYNACEFTEDVFDYVVSFHRKNNTDLNVLIYHFLMMTLSIHNPYGVSDRERSFYAFNCHKWKRQILKIYLLCSNNIKETVKNSFSKINMEFLDLFVDVSHLVLICEMDKSLHDVQVDDIGDEPGPAKKRKISNEVSNLLLDFSIEHLVNNLVMEDNWFWLKFLERFCCKYPVDLKNWYLPIVNVLCQLVCDKKSDVIVNAALRCLYCIFEAQSNITLPEKDVQLINEALMRISEELLRFMQLDKRTEGHALIQALLKHSKLIDPVPLLKLYCNKTLKGSIDNFTTLVAICQNSTLPEGIAKEENSKEENVRKLLLSWLIEGKDQYYPCEDLAKLLVVLISRKLDEEKAEYLDKQIVRMPHYSTINDFCKFITHNYRTVAFKSVQFRNQPKFEAGRSVRVDSSLKLQMVNLLKERWKILFEALAQKEASFDKELASLKNCFWFCELICHILSDMEAINESLMKDTNLMEKFKVMMNACTTKTLDLLRITFFDLRPMSKIYSGRFHEEVGKFIREPGLFNMELFDFFFNFIEDGNSNSSKPACYQLQVSPGLSETVKITSSPDRTESIVESHLDFKYQAAPSHSVSSSKWALDISSLTQAEKILVSAVEVLCQYVTIPGSHYSNEFLSNLALKIVMSLQRNATGKAWDSFPMQLTVRVIYMLCEHDGLNVAVLNQCLNFVKNIVEEKLPPAPELTNIVLEVSRRLLPLVNRSGDCVTRQTYMQILGVMRETILSREYCGIKTARIYVECLAEMHVIDPEGCWTNFETEEGEIRRAADDVLRSLKHSYHEVRLEAALLIGSFLIVDRRMARDIIIGQEELLKKVLSSLIDNNELFPKRRDCVYDYVTDVTTSASLLALAGIICRSTFWRKRTFFHLFRLSFLKKWKQCHVREVLNLIYKELEITSSEDYFKCNLRYLLEKWAAEGLRIHDFPFDIVGCTSLKEFICENRRDIMMVYSQAGQPEICDIVSTSTGLSPNNVVFDCYSMILAVILIDRKTEKGTRSKAVDNVMKLKRLVADTAPDEILSNYTARHSGKIALHMIENMHDVDYLTQLADFFGNFDDDSNPLSLTGPEILEMVSNTLNAGGKPFLEETLLKRPSVIEKMSSHLMERVTRSVIYQDRVFAFYKYVFFVEMMSGIIGKSQEYRAIGTFFIRDVLYFLFGILRKNEGNALTDMACECLKKLAEACLKEFSEIFGEYLLVTTTILIPLALQSNGKASTVLRCLVCDNYSTFEKSLALVDPFPAHETFREINERMARTEATKTKSLENQIKHFLEAGSNRNSECRVEGLKRLRKSLAEKKQELTAMYDALTTLRGFSEDCEKSFLHRLICMLVELTTSKNVLMKMEAARCLGELGPSDLTTLVLRPENNFSYLKSSDTPVKTLLMSSLNILSNLLTTDNFWLKKAVSKALYAVLSVRQGQEVHQCHAEEYRNFAYLVPFKSEKAEDLRLRIKRKVVLQNLGEKGLWTPTSHVEWITRLVDRLLQCLSDPTGIVETFRTVNSISCEFAEQLLPLLLDLIISSGDKDCMKIISNHFRGFFESIFNQKNNVKSPVVNRKSVQCLLNVVDYIRTQRHNDGIYEESCLDVNYLHLAEAAMSCSAFFTAIFYAELWFEQKRKGKYFEMNVNTVCELFPDEGFVLTQILRECHSKLGNSDGIRGCGYMHILEPPTEIQHYEHVGNWNLCLLHYDIELSMGNMDMEEGLFNSLEQSGMFYVLQNLAKMGNDSGKTSTTLYKCAMRLSDWSLLDTVASKPTDELSNDTFHKSFYFGLKAFHNEDNLTLQNEIQKATKIVLNKLVDCSLESSKNLYLPIAQLQTLKEFEEFVSVLRQNPNKSDLWTLFNKWRKQDDIRCGDFALKEFILTNRTIFLKLGLEKTKSSSIADDLRLMLYQTCCNTIATSRKERKFDTAMRMLNYLNAEEKVPREIRQKLQLEKSRILWERGDKDIGRFVLSHLIKKEEITGNLKGKCLRIYGDWMAKTKLESSPEIIGNYYLKSIALSSGSRLPVDAYASLAKFADNNYEQLNEYLSSPLFEIKQNLINTQQDLASELRQELGWNKTQNREKRMAYQIVSKQSLIDENEIKNNKSERDSYLCLALRYYLMTLRAGDNYNLFVFRVISLWLSNSAHQNVIEHLKKVLPQIPTYKFLCLLPQLVPRMADVCLISDLVERILQDHPYHTLPHLFALSNSYEDMKYSGNNKPWTTTPRVQAAQSILDKCLKTRKLETFIHEMRSFSSSLIELANYHPAERGAPGLPIQFPNHLMIKKIKNLSTVPVPSISLPYEKEGRYDAVVTVNRFEESFYLVGGINLPKRIKCIGSDGIGRSLLVKGKDDLRQDAVMQQVFTIMNSLLSENTETKKRKLIIRTYRVIPLSQRSGIIEWCENTQPMSLYLTGPDGKSGAHKKFYPDDMTAWECRSLMRKVFAQPGATNSDKLNAFLNVCKQFHPVFHYFFLENFPAAGVWFERRLAYIHSVATSSMIGYVLGIGDRHMHNILIDNATAEVIHIDLGIAFEQGKTLPIPETVPFRLTRDVVDGMGLSGVEGDFRISCIKTMQVLRENQDTILTLLEVLLYDPVHTWTITPEKAYSMQGQTEASSSATEKSSPDLEINKMAERALMRLKQKLEGTEAGWVATNVEGQVSYLVQQARDPNNLCKLFHGWQPYL